MKLVTFDRGGGPRLGVVTDDGLIDVRKAAEATGQKAPLSMQDAIECGDQGLAVLAKLATQATPQALSDVRLCTPLPSLRKNLFAVGHNYRAHVAEAMRSRGEDPKMPNIPVFFTKPPSAVIGPDDAIRYDSELTSELDYEVELVIVIGRRGRDIAERDSMDHVFGYTVGNDVSARDLQRAHGQYFKGKALDTFCPLGPAVATKTGLDGQDVLVELRVNGETRQSSRTSDMIFPIPEIIAQLSRGMTLDPGDLIMTGTPSGVALGMTPQRWLQDGDVVEAEIEGIGILRNRVVDDRSRPEGQRHASLPGDSSR